MHAINQPINALEIRLPQILERLSKNCKMMASLSVSDALMRQYNHNSDNPEIVVYINMQHQYYFGSYGEGKRGDVIYTDVLSQAFMNGLGFNKGVRYELEVGNQLCSKSIFVIIKRTKC